MRLLIAPVIAVVVIASPVFGQPQQLVPDNYTASTLAVNCEQAVLYGKPGDPSSELDAYHAALCVAKVEAWREMTRSSNVTLSDRTRVEFDHQVSNLTCIKVFVKYVHDHPQYNGHLDFEVFYWAMRDAGLTK